MDEDRKKGWHPDPYGVYKDRFYAHDNQPGRLVHDEDGTEHYDDISYDSSTILSLPMQQPRAGAAALPSPARRRQTPAVADPFPDEPIRLRTRVGERISEIPVLNGLTRWHPTFNRNRYAIAAGVLAIAVILVALVVFLPSSPHPQTKDTPFRARTTTVPQSSRRGSSSSQAVAAWRQTQAFPTSALNLNAVTCASETCFAVGETTLRTGLMLSTSNGGLTWLQQNVPNGVGALSAISCVSALQCMAVGGITVISTIDGGQQWTVQLLGKNELTSVSCPSAQECVVAGDNPPLDGSCQSGNAYTSLDGGKTWSAATLPCVLPKNIDCVSAAKCELVANQDSAALQQGEVLGSLDSGQTWQLQYQLNGAPSELNSLSCPSSLVCEVVGDTASPVIVGTANGGKKWRTQAVPEPRQQGAYLSVSCESVLVCQVAGTGKPSATDDGGRDWVTTTAPSSVSEISGISCPEVTQCAGVAETSTGSVTLNLSD